MESAFLSFSTKFRKEMINQFEDNKNFLKFENKAAFLCIDLSSTFKFFYGPLTLIMDIGA